MKVSIKNPSICLLINELSVHKKQYILSTTEKKNHFSHSLTPLLSHFMTVFNQDDLATYVNLSQMALNLAGFKDEKDILKQILDSLNEESLEKVKKLGLKEGKFSLEDLQDALNPKEKELSLEEEFRIPQAAHETVQIYLKRLRALLPQFCEDFPSVEEFVKVFTEGLHPNLKESTRKILLEQIDRLSRRSLKEFIEQLDEALKIIANSSKEKVLKPRNTCYRCQSRHNPLDLDDLEKAIDEFTDD